MSKQFNNSIEIKVDKSTLPIDGQKVKFLYKDEWFEGEYDDNEELFSTKHGFYFAWQVHEWQPTDETPRREQLPLSRDWISVEDRLPKKTGEYLAYDPNRYGENKIDVFWFDDYNKSWSILSDGYHPTHWQPFPEPPKQ
jgi:hypothetical protein